MSRVVRTEPLRGEPPVRLPGDPFSVVVLLRGYAEPEGAGGAVRADGSVTLILPRASRHREPPSEGGEAKTALEEAARGPILVDTGGPWARERLLEALAGQGVAPVDVTLVVGTHGHSDHIGNLGLFPRAALLVSHDFCLPGGCFLPHGLGEERPLRLGPGLEVWATPGHGGQRDVSVVVAGTALGTVAVVGDVFERDGDEGFWQALSEDPAAQERSRKRVLGTADVVVPGHGAPFLVVREAWNPEAEGPEARDEEPQETRSPRRRRTPVRAALPPQPPAWELKSRLGEDQSARVGGARSLPARTERFCHRCHQYHHFSSQTRTKDGPAVCHLRGFH